MVGRLRGARAESPRAVRAERRPVVPEAPLAAEARSVAPLAAAAQPVVAAQPVGRVATRAHEVLALDPKGHRRRG